MPYAIPPCLFREGGVVVSYIRVGFSVARSTVVGNARASNRGTSTIGIPTFSIF